VDNPRVTIPTFAALLLASPLSSVDLPRPSAVAVSALAEVGTPATLEAAAGVVRIATARGEPRLVEDVLRAFHRGLAGRRDVALPSELAAALDAVPESPAHDPVHQVYRLCVKLRSADPDDASLARAVARGFLKHDELRLRELRVAVIDVLGEQAEFDSQEALVVLARDSTDTVVRRAALLALQHYAEPGIASRVLTFLPTSLERHVAVDVLTRRAQWSAVLVRAVTGGYVPFEAVLPEHVQRMRRHGDAELDLLIGSVWGQAEDARERARDQVTRVVLAWEALEQPPAAPDPDELERGARVFRDACSRCHDASLSRALAPPPRALPRGGVLPAEIAEPASYELMPDADELRTTDGLLLTGRIERERAGSLTIATTVGDRTTVRREDVASVRRTSDPLMPEGLTEPLSDSELRALLLWLRDGER